MDKINEQVEIVNYYLETIENMVKAEMNEKGAELVMKFVYKLCDAERVLQMECDKLPKNLKVEDVLEWVEEG